MTKQTEETLAPPQNTQTQSNFTRAKFWNAFKNFAIIFSFIVNFVLILVLLFSPGPIFTIKAQVAEPLLVDLDSAFAALGETNIQTTINIEDTMPVVFTLPLAQNTDVVLTEAVPLKAPATFSLPGGGGEINGDVHLDLPVGMALPVNLNMRVPVSTTIPVIMEVEVNIPLAEAGMGPAIDQLRMVFSPITGFLQSLPNSVQEVVAPQKAATP